MIKYLEAVNTAVDVGASVTTIVSKQDVTKLSVSDITKVVSDLKKNQKNCAYRIHYCRHDENKSCTTETV